MDSPPTGIQLHPLNEHSDVEKINSAWIVRDGNSLPYLKRLIRYNPSIGAYKNDGTLIAWVSR